MIDASPLLEAIKRMDSRTPVAVALSSQEWADLPQELRDRSFWTARFASADLLQLMYDKITSALELGREETAKGGRFTSRSTFIGDMKEALKASGYMPEPDTEGSIKDHSSRGRLGLIFDINTRLAEGYAGWTAGQSKGALDAFPAQELYREESRIVPRAWHTRWHDHGGEFFDGRMIALKNSPIWTAISAFGSPYPPFDYNSGMGIRSISRSEAISLGVIEPGEKVHPEHLGFNDGLEGNVNRFDPSIRKELVDSFPDSFTIKDGQLQYVGGGK